MRRFAAPALPGEGGLVSLDVEVSHHMLRVTGIAPGEGVLLFDGAGQEAPAVLESVALGRASLRQVGPAHRVEAPEIHLLVAVCKHAAMDTILRMATELGATRIQPVLAARSVARGDRSGRWERIAAGAVAQSGRVRVPQVEAALPLDQALDTLPEGLERRVLVPGGPELAPARPPCALLLGPEGGLSPSEVALAQARGFLAEGLGPGVLRADTAVAAALARLLTASR